MLLSLPGVAGWDRLYGLLLAEEMNGMSDYQQYCAHVAQAAAEREAEQALTAERELDALTPVVLVAEQERRQLQAVTQMQTAATRMLREVEKVEALGATEAVASLRAEHDRLQAKAAAKLAVINKVVPASA